MSKLAQLRERRNAKAQEAQTLNAAFPADKRMPAADVEKLDAVLNEIEAIDGEIAREDRLAQLAGEQISDQQLHERALNNATRTPGAHGAESAALRSFFVGGLSALTDAQRVAMASRVNPDIRAAMSTTTTTEGGYTVATEYQRELEAAMKAYGGMLQVGDVFNTATGASMNFPTADATAEVGEIVGENAAVAAADTTFGNTAMSVYKYSSKKIALPFELIQDSFLDIEAYVREVLAVRLGRIQNLHFTTGDGSSKPYGIITGATLGKAGASGQVATVLYDDLVDLEHSVDPAYRSQPGVGFMMHDSTLKVLRKLKDDNGRPIFVPGYEQGNPGGAPDRLLNRPITINQDMATPAASAKTILFGAFKKYKIRRVMDLTLFRMTDSAFTLNGQVGFVAFQRMGGRLIDAGGAVKYYQHPAS